MAEFDRAVALAQQLIEKKGRTVTFEKRSTTLQDPTKPWLGSNQMPTQTALKAVFLNFELKEVDNTLVQRGDQKCLMAAESISGILPNTQDRIVDGSINWEIVNVNTLKPGEQEILYELQVRA